MTYTIVHVQNGCTNICRTLNFEPAWWSRPHCPTCKCDLPTDRAEHGTVVTCGQCGKPGILPDEGKLVECLGPHAEVSADGRTITFKFR